MDERIPIRPTTRQRLAEQWLEGELLLPKHDPASLAYTWHGYRTVLSHDMASGLTGFIESGNYAVDEYRNHNPSHSPQYYVVKPLDQEYQIPASGVPALSQYPVGDCDLLVIVPDRAGNWHAFGEKSDDVDARVEIGSLVHVRAHE